MKKTRKYLFAAVGMAAMLASCSSSPQTDSASQSLSPSSDSSGSSSSSSEETSQGLKIYEFSSETSGFNDFTKAFLKGQTLTSTFGKNQDAVLISSELITLCDEYADADKFNSSYENLSKTQKTQLAELLLAGLRGQAILINNATAQSIKNFLLTTKNVYALMTKSYKQFDEHQKNVLDSVNLNSETAKAFIHLITSAKKTTKVREYAMAAIMENDLYYVDPIGADSYSQATHSTTTNADSKIQENEGSAPSTPSEEERMTKYSDAQVTRLVGWIKNVEATEKGASKSLAKKAMNAAAGVETDVSDLMSAQTFTHSFTTHDGETDEVQVLAWPFYEFPNSDSKYGEDYYVVQTELTCNNQELGYKNNWSSDKTVGPYFNYATLQASLEAQTTWESSTDNVQTSDVSPQTTQGSTDFESGVSFDIGADAGIDSEGPEGGFSAGISFSQSTSRSIPDITITEDDATNGNGADWTFQAPTVQGTWSGLDTKCDGAVSIQYNTAIFDTYLIYKDVPSNEERTISTYGEIETTTLTGTLSGFLDDTINNHWNNWDNTYDYYDDVSQPNRYHEVYNMDYELSDTSVDSNHVNIISDLAMTYPGLFLRGSELYGVDQSSTDSYATGIFNEFVSNIESNPSLFTDMFSGGSLSGASCTFTLSKNDTFQTTCYDSDNKALNGTTNAGVLSSTTITF